MKQVQIEMQKPIEQLRAKRDFSDLIGLLPNTGDSVKEVREFRKKMSKEIKSWEDFEKLNQ